MSTASHLTWTNTPPSDIERTEIQLAISRAEKKKADLEASLAQNGSSEGSRIQKSVNKLDDFINIRKPVLSTLRRLPHEILSYIFTLCLDPFRTRPWHRSHWHTIPSFTLAQICRRWRAVALETPILWSFLVDVQLKPKSGSKSYIKFIETLLGRSKTLDLWIYIYAPFDELDTNCIIAPLVRHSDRWRVVTFETSPLIVAAFRGVQHRLSRLQSLLLDLSRGDEATSLNLFSDAPSLTEVTISHVNPPLELPWGQLKSFNEETKTGEGTQLPLVFRNSIDSLEHLAITLRTFVVMYTVAGVDLTSLKVPVVIPNLKTMRLTSQTNDSATLLLFLTLLISPCLEELHITSCHPASVSQPFLLLHFFALSFKHSPRPSLKRLSFRNLTHLNNIKELLCLVPHLESFEINLGTARDVLLEISGTNEQNVPLLPELKTLIIDWDQFNGIEDIIDICDGFAELTRSRCKRTIPSEDDASDQTIRTLTDISLIFTGQQSAFFIQGYLNNWCTNVGADRFLLGQYDDWRNTLHFLLPAIEGVKETELGSNCGTGVDQILTRMEDSEPQGVNYIYATQLYRSLRNLALSSKGSIPEDDKYQLRRRARAITEEWDAIMQADIANPNSRWRKNWGVSGERLQYLPDGYVFRDLSEAVQLILGIEDWVVIGTAGSDI